MPSQDFIQAGGQAPFGGIDAQSVPGFLEPSDWQELINLTVEDGTVRQRMGMIDLASLKKVQEDLHVVASPVVALAEYLTIDSVRHLIAFTTKGQYDLDSPSGTWTEVSRLRVTSAVGEPIIYGTSPLHWSGDIDDCVVVLTAIDRTLGRIIIATNGVDPPIYWDGSGNFELAPIDIPEFKSCKTMELFFNHLVLGNIDAAAKAPQVIAWSEPGNLFSFGEGVSGVALISDAKGDIRTLENFADRLVIYTEDSITVMTFIGGAAVFSMETLSHGTKLFAPKSVVTVGPFQAYMGDDNLYLFDGTRMLRPMGDRIAPKLKRSIAGKYANRAFGFSDPQRQRIFWSFWSTTTSSAGYMDTYVLEYNTYDVTKTKWSRFNYDKSNSPLCMSVFSRPSDLELKWNSDSLNETTEPMERFSWLSFDSAWEEQGGREGSQEIAVGMESGAVNILSRSVVTDPPGSKGIVTLAKTPEITVPQDYKSSAIRITEIEFEARGESLEVWYDIRSESKKILIEEVALHDSFRVYRVPCDIAVGEDLPTRGVSFIFGRFEDLEDYLTNYFELRWYRVHFNPSGYR